MRRDASHPVARRPRARRVELPIALTLASVVAAGAQEARLEPVDSFDENLRVEVVNLEVVVTDEEGERIHGLDREDFVVRLGGAEVPIRFFSEVGPETAAATPGSEPPVHFLVFVDDHTTLRRNRDFTLERLRGELSTLRPGDSMSIVAYDGRSLEVLAPWTGDVERLDAALLGAMERPTTGIKWVALARSRIFIANWIGNATRRGVLAAASSLRALPAPSGRKAMLLVAGSWDPRELAIAEDFSPWCVSGPCSGTYVFSALTDAANQLGYSIYAVDVEGRDVHGSWWREMRLQKTLAVLAAETGGRPLLNTERRRALSIAAAESRGGYYSIGIDPEGIEPGQRRAIEVEMFPSGLRARTRGSYVAVTERRHRDLASLSTLLGGAELEAPSLPLEIGPRERRKGGRMSIPVSVFAPTGRLEWVESGGVYRARFEVALATIDVHGASELETHLVTLDGSRPARPGEHEHLEFTLERRRRRHTLAVVVRDLQSERVLSALVGIERPGEEGGVDPKGPEAGGSGSGGRYSTGRRGASAAATISATAAASSELNSSGRSSIG